MSVQDHPEPVEPTMASTPDGIYCLVHGVMDCTEPFCWRCGNHQMDDFGRCADPRCRATCGPRGSLAASIIQEVKYRWGLYWQTPCPVEAIEYGIGHAMYERFCSVKAMHAAEDAADAATLGPPSSSPVGDSGADVAHDPDVRPVPE